MIHRVESIKIKLTPSIRSIFPKDIPRSYKHIYIEIEEIQT